MIFRQCPQFRKADPDRPDFAARVVVEVPPGGEKAITYLQQFPIEAPDVLNSTSASPGSNPASSDSLSYCFR